MATPGVSRSKAPTYWRARVVAFESSTEMRIFFGETERFEVGPGALRGWSCDAAVVMMSPYAGWCRSGSAALEILGEMLLLRSEDVSWGPQEDGLVRES